MLYCGLEYSVADFENVGSRDTSDKWNSMRGPKVRPITRTIWIVAGVVVILGVVAVVTRPPSVIEQAARPAARASPPVPVNTEDRALLTLKQAIVASGHDCERVLGYMSNGVARTVTCQNGSANVAFSIITRDGSTTVQMIERRR